MLVRDLFKDGLLTKMHQYYPLPAIGEYNINVKSLDVFFLLKYGNRQIATSTMLIVQDVGVDGLVKMFCDVYSQKWYKYFENLQRNLVTDVDLTITETIDGTTDNIENVERVSSGKRSDVENSYNKNSTPIASGESTQDNDDQSNLTGKKEERRTKTTTHKGINGGKIRDSISVSRYLETIFFHEIIFKDIISNITIKIF